MKDGGSGYGQWEFVFKILLLMGIVADFMRGGFKIFVYWLQSILY